MLGIAARRLGVTTSFIDPAPNPPAAGVGPVIASPFDDQAGLEQLATVSDVITYEFENVPVAAVEAIGSRVPVYPPPSALRYAQDRWHEKQLFDALKIPVPQYCRVDSRPGLAKAAATLSFPFVLKTRTLGYDGKGQAVIRSSGDLDTAWQALGHMPLIAEQWINFDYEVSIIGARRACGDIVSYPLTRNLHRGGILQSSSAPASGCELSEIANQYLAALFSQLDYVGVLALELFVSGGILLANEFAPRVHNSGHWTIEGAVTSQFENHVRAVLDMPLGDPSATGFAGMVNLIGSMPDRSRLPLDFQYFLHDYGKNPREGRKLGHITLLTDDGPTRDRRLAALLAAIPNEAGKALPGVSGARTP
jgi:5-(carboxyamino)imidazole ribonucleotide synthase